MTEDYHRYEVPPERALSIAAGASVTLSSLLALERHESEAATSPNQEQKNRTRPHRRDHITTETTTFLHKPM